MQSTYYVIDNSASWLLANTASVIFLSSTTSLPAFNEAIAQLPAYNIEPKFRSNCIKNININYMAATCRHIIIASSSAH